MAGEDCCAAARRRGERWSGCVTEGAKRERDRGGGRGRQIGEDNSFL